MNDRHCMARDIEIQRYLVVSERERNDRDGEKWPYKMTKIKMTQMIINKQDSKMGQT